MTLKENRKNNQLHKLIKLDKEDRHLLKEHSFSIRRKDGTHGIYARTKIKRKEVSLHNLIFPKKEGFIVDHINRDTFDNRKKNLRYVTFQQNTINRKMQKNNKSGYRGVYWFKRIKKWRAKIGFNGVKISIGYFSDIKEAAKAYNKAAKKYFGKYAVLNKI